MEQSLKVVNNEEDEYIKVMSLRTQIEDGESNYFIPNK